MSVFKDSYYEIKVTEDTEVYHVDPENIAGFLESIRRVVTGIFHEAIGLAQYVYEECFVKGNSLEDIMPGDPRTQKAITAVYCCTWMNRMPMRAMRLHRRDY